MSNGWTLSRYIRRVRSSCSSTRSIRIERKRGLSWFVSRSIGFDGASRSIWDVVYEARPGRHGPVGVAAGGSGAADRLAGALRRPAGLRPLPRRLRPLEPERRPPRRPGPPRPALPPAPLDAAARGPRPLPRPPRARRPRALPQPIHGRAHPPPPPPLPRPRPPRLHRRHRDPGDTAVRLLHPFTGDIAELPPLSSLLPQMEHYGNMTEDRKRHTLRGFLSGVSAAVTVGPATAGAITVMLALEIKQLVAHATTGDQRWTLSAGRLPCLLGPTVSFHGNLYAVTPKSAQRNSVCIWQIDAPQPDAAEGRRRRSLLPSRIIAHCPLAATEGAVSLVECGSELMLVGFSDAQPTGLVVYRVADLISGRVVSITDIGEHALFLGQRPLYASQNKGLPSVVANSITIRYRVTKNNPLRGGRASRSTEQYHIGTGCGTWSPAIDGDISCWERPPASPYMLIHHIFTCCVTLSY